MERARNLIAPFVSRAADAGWGGVMICTLTSAVALVPLVAAGRLSSPTHVALALVLALGVAAAWSVVLLVPAWAIASALPGLGTGLLARWRTAGAASGSVRTIAGVLTLASLEIGIAAGASDFARHHDTAHAVARGSTAAVPTIILTVALVLGLRHWREQRWLLRAALLIPALVPAVLFAVLPDHLRATDAVVWGLWIAASLPYAASLPAPRTRGRRLAVLLTAPACFAVLALGFGARPGLAALLYDAHAPTRWVVEVGRRSTDFDGDGSSAFFGGRDCAPFDALRGPLADELAGNGIDDNCLLGDLADDRPRSLPAGDVPTTSASARPNVLVLSVDALRPDRMSSYGYARPTTPRIDEHFADSIRFTRAYAEAASTRDTLASLLTGRSIAELQWHHRKAVVLDPRTRTLAHWLAEAGYRTIGVFPFVALNMMGATDLGFATTEIYDEKPANTAAVVNARLLAALRAEPGPFFAFAHYFEPHYAYHRHPRHRDVSADPYDQEIAAVDAAIGDLLDELRADGTLDDTLLVLTSDHGEAFGEHGHRFHDSGVYEEDLRVPWLLRIPGGAAADIEAPVSTTALVATVYDVLDRPLPAEDGPTIASVLPLHDPAVSAPPVLATARWGIRRERLALIEGETKILFDRELSAFEVYDLARDPGERYDLGIDAPQLVDARVAAAAEVMEHVVGAAASRRRRGRAHAELPARARPVPADAPPGHPVRGAWAELSRGIDGTGLPPRVLVHTIVRSDFDGVLEVALHDGDVRMQEVVGPIAPGVEGIALVEDIRTFKVYVRDAAQTVELVIDQWQWSLGAVADLPVAAESAPANDPG